jgi:hypothetical protein
MKILFSTYSFSLPAILIPIILVVLFIALILLIGLLILRKKRNNRENSENFPHPPALPTSASSRTLLDSSASTSVYSLHPPVTLSVTNKNKIEMSTYEEIHLNPEGQIVGSRDRAKTLKIMNVTLGEKIGGKFFFFFFFYEKFFSFFFE